MAANSEFHSGFTSDRNSSRILQPPGGGCSDIFGTNQPASNKSKVKSNVFGSGDDQESSKMPPRVQDNIFGSAPPASQEAPKVDEEDGEKKEAEENGENNQKEAPKTFKGRGQFNPITGEPYDAQPAAKIATTPSTRVKQPPGGASTKLW